MTRKSGLDVSEISTRSQHWKQYEPQLEARMNHFGESSEEVVASFFRGSDLARRYCRRKLWSIFRVNVTLGQIPIELNATQSEAFWVLAYGVAESVHNTLTNAHDEARDLGVDVYPAMYDALWDYLRENVQAQFFVYGAAWDKEEAVTSLSGWIASIATTKTGQVRHASYRRPLASEYHRSSQPGNSLALPDNTAEGLLSEIPAEAADALLSHLREAEASNTPAGFDLGRVTNQALNNIRVNLGGVRLTEEAIARLVKEQETLPFEEEVNGMIRAEEMRREAQKTLSPAEWKVFQLLEQPDITESEIAAALKVTVGTVKTQKSRLRAKLNTAGWRITEQKIA